MKFSVLMSIYYKENATYFKQAMESILIQTKKPNEIVIIEDGPISKDLKKTLSEYQKKYPQLIKVYSLEKNQGLGKALAHGIDMCQYDIVARMDADDIAISTRFEKQLSFLSKNPNCDIIGSNIIECDENMKEISLKKVPDTDKKIKKYAKKRNPFNHMSIMYRKNCIVEVGNYQTCYGFEDYYLWCRILQKGFVAYNIQTPLIKARTGATMTLRRGGKKYIQNIICFEYKILKMGYINIFQYLFNILSRVFISLLPNQLRYFFYRKHLRKEVVK